MRSLPGYLKERRSATCACSESCFDSDWTLVAALFGAQTRFMFLSDEMKREIRSEVERALRELGVTPEPRTKPQTEFLTTAEVARTYKRHAVTVRIALGDGSLHGHQQAPGSTWLIEKDCAEAWLNGAKCEHYKPSVKLTRRR